MLTPNTVLTFQTTITINSALPIFTRLYWTDSNSNRLKSANLDGTASSDVLCSAGCANNDIAVQGVQDIAVDLAGGKLYWTDFGTNRVMRSDLDGTNSESLICKIGCTYNNSSIDSPEGIALDLTNGKMYWTDSGKR